MTICRMCIYLDIEYDDDDDCGGRFVCKNGQKMIGGFSETDPCTGFRDIPPLPKTAIKSAPGIRFCLDEDLFFNYYGRLPGPNDADAIRRLKADFEKRSNDT